MWHLKEPVWKMSALSLRRQVGHPTGREKYIFRDLEPFIICFEIRMQADSDTDHYLVVAKVRERLAVSKQATHKF
jgi:hypothetical protein